MIREGRRGLAGCFALLGMAWAASGEELRLSRSIYVPVVFSVHADIAGELLIWIGDETKPRHAMQHTFLFTLFPDQGKRFLPEYVEVRVKAAGACDGADLDTNFVVTAGAIHTGEESLEFDVEQLAKQVRVGRRDLRVPQKIVRIKCEERGAPPTDPPVGSEPTRR